MKKLVALVLVLGVASMASAILTIAGADKCDLGDSLTIGISSDGINSPLEDVYKLVISGQQTESLLGAAINYLDGTHDPGGVYSGGPGIVYLDFSTGGTPSPIWPDPDENTPVAGGIQLTNILSPLTLTLSNITGSIILDTANIEIIPEPATMALMGLGVWFLRRRK